MARAADILTTPVGSTTPRRNSFVGHCEGPSKDEASDARAPAALLDARGNIHSPDKRKRARRTATQVDVSASCPNLHEQRSPLKVMNSEAMLQSPRRRKARTGESAPASPTATKSERRRRLHMEDEQRDALAEMTRAQSTGTLKCATAPSTPMTAGAPFESPYAKHVRHTVMVPGESPRRTGAPVDSPRRPTVAGESPRRPQAVAGKPATPKSAKKSLFGGILDNITEVFVGPEFVLDRCQAV